MAATGHWARWERTWVSGTSPSGVRRVVCGGGWTRCFCCELSALSSPIGPWANWRHASLSFRVWSNLITALSFQLPFVFDLLTRWNFPAEWSAPQCLRLLERWRKCHEWVLSFWPETILKGQFTQMTVTSSHIINGSIFSGRFVKPFTLHSESSADLFNPIKVNQNVYVLAFFTGSPHNFSGQWSMHCCSHFHSLVQRAFWSGLRQIIFSISRT